MRFFTGCMGTLLSVGVAGAVIAQPFTGEGGPNDTVETRTVLPAGELGVSGELFSTTKGPDTVMRAFVNDVEFAVDDDGSEFGTPTASGLFGVPVSNDGSIWLEVTGHPDFDFMGFHEEYGNFDIIIEVFDDTGTPSTGIISDRTLLSPGNTETLTFSNPSWTGDYSYTASIDNTAGFGNDIDYFEFTDLEPFAVYSAAIASPDPIDTILARVDDDGSIFETDDDGGGGLLSRITFIADPSRSALFAVTGYPNDSLDSGHTEVGDYDLILTPGPTVGDFSRDGFISQADLDLVLLNWGTIDLPGNYGLEGTPLNGFDDFVSQNELDLVLLGWGDGTPPTPESAAIPEPGTAGALAALTLAMTRRSRNTRL